MRLLAYAFAALIGVGVGLDITRSRRRELENLAPTWRRSGLAAVLAVVLFVVLAEAFNEDDFYLAWGGGLGATLFVTRFFRPWLRTRTR